MITAPILAWCTIALGVAVAFALGWLGPSGFWAALGLLFADVFLGLALTYALYFVFGWCLETLKMCEKTDDRTVWAITFPLIFIPGYWVSTLLGKGLRPKAIAKNESGAS